MIKYCNTCALANKKLLKCKTFGHDINPNTDFCSKHADSIPVCDICGREMLPEHQILEILDDDNVRVICPSCNEMFGSCAMCLNNKGCAYDDDPSPIPKLIQKQVRQGPMITVTQEINPERVVITCKKGCSCFDPENGCLRQFNTCGGYESI